MFYIPLAVLPDHELSFYTYEYTSDQKYDSEHLSY